MIKKFRTYEVDVLISHCVHAEVEKENNLHSIQREHRTNSERYMEVERGRNHRRKSDGGSYPFANINTACQAPVFRAG